MITVLSGDIRLFSYLLIACFDTLGTIFSTRVSIERPAMIRAAFKRCPNEEVISFSPL
jgi:hypothetical protein